MKLLERTLVVVCVYSLILWAFSAATALNMLGLSFTILATFYLLLGFAVFNNVPFTKMFSKQSYQYTNVRRVIGSIVAGLAMAMVAVAVIFKFLYVAGDSEMVHLALSACSIVMLSVFSMVYWRKRKPDSYYRGILIRVCIAFAIGMILLLTDKTTLLKTYYRNHPEKAAAIIELKG